jgi:hypothetical protein
MLLPVIRVPRVLDREDLGVVALPRVQVGIAGLELQIDALSAGFPVIILELDFGVDPPVLLGDAPENLPESRLKFNVAIPAACRESGWNVLSLHKRLFGATPNLTKEFCTV